MEKHQEAETEQRVHTPAWNQADASAWFTRIRLGAGPEGSPHLWDEAHRFQVTESNFSIHAPAYWGLMLR